MSFTPTGINMLVAACDRAEAQRRIDAMQDLRSATLLEAKDFKKMIGEMRRAMRGVKPRG